MWLSEEVAVPKKKAKKKAKKKGREFSIAGVWEEDFSDSWQVLKRKGQRKIIKVQVPHSCHWWHMPPLAVKKGGSETQQTKILDAGCRQGLLTHSLLAASNRDFFC